MNLNHYESLHRGQVEGHELEEVQKKKAGDETCDVGDPSVDVLEKILKNVYFICM